MATHTHRTGQAASGHRQWQHKSSQQESISTDPSKATSSGRGRLDPTRTRRPASSSNASSCSSNNSACSHDRLKPQNPWNQAASDRSQHHQQATQKLGSGEAILESDNVKSVASGNTAARLHVQVAHDRDQRATHLTNSKHKICPLRSSPKPST
ncbi:hypothetical protein ACLOJK_004340 [Asimina triloba]